MNHKVWIRVLMLGFISGATGQALGQQAAPSAAAAEPAKPSAPDVVLLTNGDLFRGTIAEKTQDQTVIVLVTGETRRLPAAQIRYAGPAEHLPKPEAEAEATQSDEDEEARAEDESKAAEQSGPRFYPVYFTANRPKAMLYFRGEGSGFHRFCSAPCKRDLIEGPYTLAVKSEEDGSTLAQRQLMLDYPTSVDLNYRSRAGLRGTGAFLAVLSSIVGLGVTGFDLLDEDEQLGTASIATLSLAIPGLITGLVLLSVGDAADVKVASMPGSGGEKEQR